MLFWTASIIAGSLTTQSLCLSPLSSTTSVSGAEFFKFPSIVLLIFPSTDEYSENMRLKLAWHDRKRLRRSDLGFDKVYSCGTTLPFPNSSSLQSAIKPFIFFSGPYFVYETS